MSELEKAVNSVLDGCPHKVIVEDVRYPDGSIMGKCLACGEKGFPIRDIAWEEFKRQQEKENFMEALRKWRSVIRSREDFASAIDEVLRDPSPGRDVEDFGKL